MTICRDSRTDPYRFRDSSGLTGEYWTEWKSPDTIANYDAPSIFGHMIYRGNDRHPPAKAIWTNPCGQDRLVDGEALHKSGGEDTAIKIEGRNGVMHIHSRYALIDHGLTVFNSIARWLCKKKCP